VQNKLNNAHFVKHAKHEKSHVIQFTTQPWRRAQTDISLKVHQTELVSYEDVVLF
jgi:hypothetical protein